MEKSFLSYSKEYISFFESGHADFGNDFEARFKLFLSVAAVQEQWLRTLRHIR